MSVSRRRIEIPPFVEPVEEREAERRIAKRSRWVLKRPWRFAVIVATVVVAIAAVTVVVLPAHEAPAPPTTVQTVPKAVSSLPTVPVSVSPPVPIDLGPVRAPLVAGPAGVCGILPTPACNGKEERVPAHNGMAESSMFFFTVSKGQVVIAPISGTLDVLPEHQVLIGSRVDGGVQENVGMGGVLASWPEGTEINVKAGQTIGTVISETPVLPDVSKANLVAGFATTSVSKEGAWLSSMQKELLAH